jgi:hypothetical protein
MQYQLFFYNDFFQYLIIHQNNALNKHTVEFTHNFNFQQVNTTNFSCMTARQLSIIPNAQEDHLLFACENTGILYYSIDSSMSFTLLKTFAETDYVCGV